MLALAALVAAGQSVRADDTADQIKALREQIDALDQKVRILERQQQVNQEAADTKTKELPDINIGRSGLTVTSPDTNFAVGIHGVLQTDTRTFINDNGIQGNGGFILRRARPILSGTVYRDFDFMFIPDFGGSSSPQIFDAYVNYRYEPWLQLRAGKFKSPFGLEQLQQDVNITFNERSLATDLTPNRDIGFMLWGEVGGGALSYAAGVFNGVGDARISPNNAFDDHHEAVARLFLQPFKQTDWTPLRGLGFGVAGSYGNVRSNSTALPNTTGGTLGGFTTDGQQQFFAYNPSTNGAIVADGTHWRLSPQGYYYWGPFGLLGEYVISDQGVRGSAKPFAEKHLDNTAWELTGSWVLTGEDASFNGIVPKHPFDLSAGHWGAFQLAARYAELDVDKAAFPLFANPASSASSAQAWSVGLNWYLNRNIRVDTSFSRTTFTGGGEGTSAPGSVTRQPEEVFFTRLQLGF